LAKITKIEGQKNKSRVNIFVDDTFFCGLEKETAIIFGLKVGKEVDEKQLSRIIEESEIKRAFEKAADYLASRMHSKKELIDKLIKKGFLKAHAEAACEKLSEYGYVNDEAFAKAFVQQNSKYSKLILENKLRVKGIDKSIISEVIDSVSDDLELELCKKQAEKFAKGKDLSTLNGKQKLYASLARKGFSFGVIKSAISQVLSDFDIDDME